MPTLWHSHAPLDYPTAITLMEARSSAIHESRAPETLWLLEHPPIYTAGTSAKPSDLLTPSFPVYATGRGGQYTYHGPGQRVAYVMLNLAARARKNNKAPDLRAYVEALERVIIATLATFGITGFIRHGRVGVWVARPDKPRGQNGDMAEDKIAAIGVRVRHGVSFHGLAINVNPDLSHFQAIVPCGIKDAHLGVTSFYDLGVAATLVEVDRALVAAFAAEFGAIKNSGFGSPQLSAATSTAST